MEAGDLDRWTDRFSADLVDVDHTSHATTGREELLRMIHVYAATERHAVHAELLATLGERHLLQRMTTRMEGAAIVNSGNRTGTLEIVLLTVMRIDTEGRTTRIERFKPDDLGPALARLIELHADDELPPERRQGRYAVAAMLRDQDVDWRQDAVEVDHRPASLGILEGRDAIRQATAALRGLSSAQRWRVADVFGFTGDIAFTEFVSEGRNDEGGAVQFRVVVINQFSDDGLILQSELYRPDQIDEAFARFDELCQPVQRPQFPPPNTAALARTRATDALVRGDVASYLACFAPGVLYEDRKYRFSVSGLGAIEDDARRVLAIGNLSKTGVQRLATRGNRLSLHRTLWQYHPTDSGPVDREMLELNETDADGLICSFSLFEGDDLDAAFAELDARFAAGEGASFDWASQVANLAAYDRRDWAAFQASLAQDVRHVDHRPARFGEQDREQLLSAMRTLFDLVPDARVRLLAVPRLSAYGHVIVYERTGHDETGANVTWREASVSIMRDGRIQRIESFAIEDLPAALARFELLSQLDPRESC
jgi:hypothetical protein